MPTKDENFVLTPLGAAIVEAMPDRERVKKIKADFRRRAWCPVSAIFNVKAVEEFYRQRGQKVIAI